jgi:hypothetical protein
MTREIEKGLHMRQLATTGTIVKPTVLKALSLTILFLRVFTNR